MILFFVSQNYMAQIFFVDGAFSCIPAHLHFFCGNVRHNETFFCHASGGSSPFHIITVWFPISVGLARDGVTWVRVSRRDPNFFRNSRSHSTETQVSDRSRPCWNNGNHLDVPLDQLLGDWECPYCLCHDIPDLGGDHNRIRGYANHNPPFQDHPPNRFRFFTHDGKEFFKQARLTLTDTPGGHNQQVSWAQFF